jgi:putative transposase
VWLGICDAFCDAAIPISGVAFLHNLREAIVAFDFFTVPTVTFQLLYCLFVIEHGQCKILHFNVTRHPTAEWVNQQLRETFPDAGSYRYVILDWDRNSTPGSPSF